ncbi:hypothetical protein ESCAB7627_2327 [Escherichia albertii TW07627]|uniref:Uncharacterized protein n=1 Tax=Escherichia albertii (strain TW07627) TaxID=502347 RepID=A0ABC9NNH3_ESCAT|nr:hypothetical protein ESCAB7627_2327 [Escherichia albertii TW07627]OSL32197.1 hypothetical protein EAPG_00846 [Escherichia albertii B156]
MKIQSDEVATGGEISAYRGALIVKNLSRTGRYHSRSP